MISDIISIKTMSKIFQEDATCKVKPLARMVYQNIINHWFSNKRESIGELMSFEMFKEDVKYDKLKSSFDNLQKAGLIVVEQNKIKFVDVWVKHLNISNLSTEKCKMILAEEVKDEMYNSHSLSDIIRMKYRVTIKQSHLLLKMFFSEQDAIKTTYNNQGQVRKHFIYWCQNNLDKVKSEHIKSTGKILGKEKQ